MSKNTLHIPRIIISALRGGGGKTLLSLGLCRAFLQRDLAVKPFKKGPDYIDARWLELSAKASCTNMDPYFLDAQRLQSLFAHAWQQGDYALALVEGNRGLFDGQDVQGTCSTAELSRVLQAPVILSLDITKMTRTSAALLQGMAHFEEGVRIAGVVLNQVGSARHEKIVREAIEQYTDIPVLGALPRLKENPLPERHMGLCQTATHEADAILDSLGSLVAEHCDVERLYALAHGASALQAAEAFWPELAVNSSCVKPVRIGYVYDDAFWFYYAENLEALCRAGAELVPLSLLEDTPWPKDLQGLYLGGGYPEEYLEQLSASPHLATLQALSHAHMPIYAECGGFMILAQSIIRHGKEYAMSGVFPVQSEFHSRPQGLGYVQATVCTENPYHAAGAMVRGHEFHYSKCIGAHAGQQRGEHALCFTLAKGTGMGHGTLNEGQSEALSGAQDGLLVRQTFASYTHIFAPSCPWWAENFVSRAAAYRSCEGNT